MGITWNSMMTHLSFFLSYTRSHYSLKQSGCKLQIRTLLICNGSNSLNQPKGSVQNALYDTQNYSMLRHRCNYRNFTRCETFHKFVYSEYNLDTTAEGNCVQTFPHRKGKLLRGGDFMSGEKINLCDPTLNFHPPARATGFSRLGFKY